MILRGGGSSESKDTNSIGRVELTLTSSFGWVLL